MKAHEAWRLIYRDWGRTHTLPWGLLPFTVRASDLPDGLSSSEGRGRVLWCLCRSRVSLHMRGRGNSKRKSKTGRTLRSGETAGFGRGAGWSPQWGTRADGREPWLRA